MPAKSCQSQTWPCLSGRPWVVCLCQRSYVTARDALHFSQWNLSSTWDFRPESGNHCCPVTSVFSLNKQAGDTQLPKAWRILKMIYWWHLQNCACEFKLINVCNLVHFNKRFILWLREASLCLNRRYANVRLYFGNGLRFTLQSGLLVARFDIVNKVLH